MTITRRAALLGLALLGAAGIAADEVRAGASQAASLSPEDTRDVARVVAYLQGLTTAEGRFVQSDARGGESAGTFYLQRPGRARFDYDPPSGLVIASDGHEVSVVNHRLKTIQSYPLGLTPLALFLARDIRLDKGVKVTQVIRGEGGFTIVAQDARKKNNGSIALNFSNSPLALTGWTVTDARGGKVKVLLQGFARAEPREPTFFRLADPRPAPDMDIPR